ncbi:serine O-acetyltransferase [Methylobacterium pseudosasicola]|uniref:Serine acetyltransferase n=1 Tax=Methylobacterium pseudosasicola TaxID=582667 RepID=A0A1I4F5I1_9HYPH|nr:serine O-acetyltransferase [Methylobacterium pseudosasicola]SFL13164.1 serine O-acetyltransferase [Methylobacterium pseudosasicola]
MSASPALSPAFRHDADDLAVCDPVWSRLRAEAEDVLRTEPQLASFIVATILNHATLEGAVAHRVAARLGHPSLPAELVAHAFHEAIAADPAIGQAFRADIGAVIDRDPATLRALEPVLYFKGFHALQAYRLAHHVWTRGRRDLALYLQSRVSEVFQCDIHPAARIGRGVFLDHATGLVVGSTAVIEDDVSILHGVTLGGTGKQRGDRHPKIRRGVMIGAGAKILGNIEVGACARVAAGSVVLRPVPANTTVVGVPARVVGTAGCDDPARAMDQLVALDQFIHVGDGI